MNVGEYAAKFEELSRYHFHYHNAINERPRCVKFVNGLCTEIKEAIRLQEIQEFSTLVNRCRIFEEDHKARIAKFIEHRSESSETELWVSICNKPGHMSRDCPMVKKEGDGGNRNYYNQNLSGGVASRPKAYGKVFAMSEKEVSHSDMMIGGASHSFISTSCVEQLRLPTIALPFDLSVHTPSNDPVITAKACSKCPISIDGRNFIVNLFCFPLKELEVILGLDCLSDNHVIIDCCRKTIVFRDFEHDNSE
ncbi:uncharacterized protein LOC113859831 [Abrus precatorius]|uniref:Uncharacterized protein LOC113859831 n=1 Tax=Abrus precatorius TaxID=3816 RepID=A0A8B8KWH7_ABRPR|nr:uncharacterized protein LOC113859831 [Abrus precatorius]